MRTINPNFAIAIQEYQSGHFDKPALATRHRVSLSTIHNWIRRAGASRRSRGRPPLEEPTSMHRQIIDLSAKLTGREIARHFGVSRQRVHQVLKRWKHLPPQGSDRMKPVAGEERKKGRELRNQVISFRLTAPQADQVRSALVTSGLGNRLSRGAACRAVLLAALGVGKFQLAHAGVTIDQNRNDGRDVAVDTSACGDSVG